MHIRSFLESWVVSGDPTARYNWLKVAAFAVIILVIAQINDGSVVVDRTIQQQQLNSGNARQSQNRTGR